MGFFPVSRLSKILLYQVLLTRKDLFFPGLFAFPLSALIPIFYQKISKKVMCAKIQHRDKPLLTACAPCDIILAPANQGITLRLIENQGSKGKHLANNA